MRHRFISLLVACAATAQFSLPLAPAFGQQAAPVHEPEPPAFTNELLKKEPGIGKLPTGAKALVDDGTCPAGKIKQVIGGNVATGQPRIRSCVPRP